MNIGSLLSKASRLQGNRLAIQHGEQQLTYAELNQRVGQLARALQSLGVCPGDRVVLVQRNGPAMFETLFACFRAGAAVVPVNVRLHPEEVAFICQDCKAKVLVATGEYATSALQAHKQMPELQLFGVESIADAFDYETLLSASDSMNADAEVDPDDLAWLFYTSGTTGKPKGAMLTHRNLLAMMMNYYSQRRNECYSAHAQFRSPDGLCLDPAPARDYNSVSCPDADQDDAQRTVPILRLEQSALYPLRRRTDVCRGHEAGR